MHEAVCELLHLLRNFVQRATQRLDVFPFQWRHKCLHQLVADRLSHVALALACQFELFQRRLAVADCAPARAALQSHPQRLSRHFPAMRIESRAFAEHGL
jgi:hypothetical protein